MTKEEQPKDTQVTLWSVALSDEDWYWVFARSAKEAESVVLETHYSDLSRREFRREYKPNISAIDPKRKLLVNDEGTGKQRNWTAERWCKNQSPGPFVSNTYDC